MFTRVVKLEVTVPLWPDQAPGAPPAFPNNAAYLQNDFATLLTQAFPHLDVATIQAFVLGATPPPPLARVCQDPKTMLELISLRVSQGCSRSRRWRRSKPIYATSWCG